jgi:hypothetical protein
VPEWLNTTHIAIVRGVSTVTAWRLVQQFRATAEGQRSTRRVAKQSAPYEVRARPFLDFMRQRDVPLRERVLKLEHLLRERDEQIAEHDRRIDDALSRVQQLEQVSGIPTRRRL